jgi:RNA polymerase sigma-70 factor, ECF subfamily
MMPDLEASLRQEIMGHRDDVFRVCLGLMRNSIEAEDMCQEVLLKALARAGKLRQPEALRIWLLRAARTTCLDHHRRRLRAPFVHIDPSAESSAANPRTPESITEMDEDLRRLKSVIEKLPRKHREILVLREYGGLTYEDLSRTLKIRPGTVMSRLGRARRAVALAMEDGHE